MRDLSNFKYRIERFVKDSTVLTLIISTILGSTTARKMKEADLYSDNEQIFAIAEALDADTTSITNNEFNNPIRLRHNEDEPIYIHIDEDFSEEEYSCATFCVDYIFRLLKEINPLYRYQLVDKSTIISKAVLDKSIIYMGVKPELYKKLNKNDSSYGLTIHTVDPFLQVLDKDLNKSAIIFYDQTLGKLHSKKQKEFTMIHELMHAICYNDVYTHENMDNPIDRYCGNTLMNVGFSGKMNILSPNDYKNMLAAMSPYVPADKLDIYITKLEYLADLYEEEYYDVFTKTCLEDLGFNSQLNTFRTYDLNYTISTTRRSGEHVSESYKISVSPTEYQLTIIDKNGSVVESITGEVNCANNCFVLKDVDYKTGMHPGITPEQYQYEDGFIVDLIIAQDENGQIYLYSLDNENYHRLKELNPPEDEMAR